MRLLNKIKEIFNTEDDIDIALQLFESQGIGGNIGSKAKAILKNCKTRQDVFLKAIELCGENPSDPKPLYIVSHCYVWLGAKYRTKAIEYLEKYIAVGGVWSGTPSDIIEMNGYSVDQLASNKASVYSYLGKAYEGEYMFEKAETAYTAAEKLIPYFATYSVCVSDTYVKRNDLHKALHYLNSKKQTSYYKKNVDDYRILLDKAISDIEGKIKKGYIYKPRKKSNK